MVGDSVEMLKGRLGCSEVMTRCAVITSTPGIYANHGRPIEISLEVAFGLGLAYLGLSP